MEIYLDGSEYAKQIKSLSFFLKEGTPVCFRMAEVGDVCLTPLTNAVGIGDTDMTHRQIVVSLIHIGTCGTFSRKMTICYVGDVLDLDCIKASALACVVNDVLFNLR